MKIVYFALFFSLFSFAARAQRNPMMGKNDRYVIGIYPGTEIQPNKKVDNVEVVNSVELSFLYQKAKCTAASFHQIGILYGFNNSYNEYGARYRINLTMPTLYKTMIYPFISIKGSMYTYEEKEGYLAQPAVGFSFVFHRKKTPYLALNTFYGYNFDIEQEHYPYNAHTVNFDLGLGVVW